MMGPPHPVCNLLADTQRLGRDGKSFSGFELHQKGRAGLRSETVRSQESMSVSGRQKPPSGLKSPTGIVSRSIPGWLQGKPASVGN